MASKPQSPAGPSSLQIAVLLVALAAALVAFGVLGGRGQRPKPEWIEAAAAFRSQWVGRAMPRFDLARRGGGTLGPQDLAGQVVLLHFWASWCPTCLPELPKFVELEARLRPAGLRVLHVSLDETWDAAIAALPQGFAGETLLDPNGPVAHAFGTEKLPETYLIARDGTVLLRFVSNQPWLDADLLTLLRAALQEP